MKLISIAADSERLLRNFKEENGFSVNIVADRLTKIIKQYGVYWYAKGGGGTMKVKQAFPSTFIINKNKLIVWKYIGQDKTDRPSMEKLLSVIDDKIK